MELVLVRHALPVRIDATEDGTPADPGLDEIGRQQAERVLAALAGQEVSALYASPARRARETAAPLAASLGLPVTVLQGLAEFDAAHTSYVPVEQLRAEGDPRFAALVRGDLSHSGVDPVVFRATVVEAVEQAAAAHPGGRAVLFAHSGTINAYCGHVVGQQRPLWFAPAYASVSRVGAARDGRHREPQRDGSRSRPAAGRCSFVKDSATRRTCRP
jgi:probable phosphoglycerate mutase